MLRVVLIDWGLWRLRVGLVLAQVLCMAIGLWMGMPAAHALDTEQTLRQCRLDSWGAKDGLPPRTVRAITQTDDGYLWLATDGGLVRFDGVSFHVYNTSNTPGFSRANVTSLLTARDGTLWAGTNGSGFGTFVRGVFQRRDDAGHLWTQTNVICQGSDGAFWFGGEGDGGAHRLSRLTAGTGSLWDSGLPSACMGMVADAQGGVWMATSNNGLLHETQPGRYITFFANSKLPSLSLTALCQGADGSLWIGTQSSGLCHDLNGHLTFYTTHDGLPSDHIQTILADREGRVWIGTREGLAYQQGNQFQAFRKVDGLSDNSVQALFEDREGNLWVGNGSGLCRFANTKLTPVALRTPSGGVAQPVEMCQAADGSVWCATDAGLERRLHGVTTWFTTRNGLPNNALSSVCIAADGSLWLLTQSDSLIHWSHGKFTLVQKVPPYGHIARDRDGLLLIAWGLIARWNGKTIKPIPTFTDPTKHFIFSYLTDRHGTFWFGCDAGLGEVTGNSVHFFNVGLPSHAKVLSLTQGEGDTLWLGLDTGLARFQNGKFTVYTPENGLPEGNSLEVAEDADQTLWVGCDLGIYTIKTADLDAFDHHAIPRLPATLYTSSDGIRSFPSSFWAFKTQRGDLWFPGVDGFTVIKPQHLIANALPPPVVIEQATANGHAIIQDGGGRRLRAAMAPPGSGSLEIDYTAPSFVAPEKVLFRYQLVGYDTHWVNAGTRRAAYYTNLAPGHYVFRVQACNNDGVWNRQGAAFPLTLEPHYYQTRWFQALCLLVGLMLLVGLYLLRTQSLRRRNQALESYAAERTTALVRAVDKLQKTTVQLAHSNEEKEATEEELRAQNDELIATKALLEVQNHSLIAANDRLEALATRDVLTGLPNHRAMMEAIDAEVQRAAHGDRPCALLFLDIDHFKALNDAFGHPAGDAALQEFAETVRTTLRGMDTLGRWGGEEFVALLPETDAAGAMVAAEHVRARVAEQLFRVAGGLHLTCSIGVACCPGDAGERDSLLTAADAAMYAAKHLGRNQARAASDTAVQTLLTERDGSGSREETALAGVVQALTSLVEARHPHLPEHTQNVALLAIQIADALEIPGAESRQIGLAARLHNIGLVAVADAVFEKVSRLTSAERARIRQHPALGAEIVGHVPGLRPLVPMILAHHERWDGGGYPCGLAGKAIPLGARILAVADAYVAMISPRPYRPARDGGWAMAELDRCAGSQFDPEVVRALRIVLSHTTLSGLSEDFYAKSTF